MYDLKNLSINGEINFFNRKLAKLDRIFPHVNILGTDDNRLLFTRHGLHLSGLGKELLANYLVLHIYSSLKEVTVSSSSSLSCWSVTGKFFLN